MKKKDEDWNIENHHRDYGFDDDDDDDDDDDNWNITDTEINGDEPGSPSTWTWEQTTT